MDGFTYLDILQILQYCKTKGLWKNVHHFQQQFLTIDILHYSTMIQKRILKLTTNTFLLPCKHINFNKIYQGYFVLGYGCLKLGLIVLGEQIVKNCQFTFAILHLLEVDFHLNQINFLLPKNNFCKFWMNVTQRFWKKDENPRFVNMHIPMVSRKLKIFSPPKISSMGFRIILFCKLYNEFDRI